LFSDVNFRKTQLKSSRSKNDRLQSASTSPLVVRVSVPQVLNLQRDALLAAGIAEHNL